MNYQAREEKGNEQGPAKAEFILMMGRGLSEPEKEEKSAQEKNRVMIGEHGPGEEPYVNCDEALWDRAAEGFFFRIGRLMGVHFGELIAEVEPENEVGNDNGGGGFPAEMLEHERHVPVPFAGDHEHWRGGEMSERAADRDVDEEEAERGVGEFGGRESIVEFLCEEECGDGHGGGLGDERAE